MTIFTWWRDRRRRRWLDQAFPDAWLDTLNANIWQYECLPPEAQRKIRKCVMIMVREKTWVGCKGLKLSEGMKVTIAGKASLLLLGVEDFYFGAVQSILVHPTAYVHQPQATINLFGGSGSGPVGPRAILGESWSRGPVVLSWREIEAESRGQRLGRNLVVHEFAHQLDDINGGMDGDLPIFEHALRKRWEEISEMEYTRHLGAVQRGQPTLLDPYGATNRAEFFSVASETFFEQPHRLHHEHPELHAVLQDFYRIDLTRWIPAHVARQRQPASVSQGANEHAAGQRGEPAGAAAGGALPEFSELPALQNADDYFTRAVSFFLDGLAEQAVHDFTRSLELNPNDGEAHQQRALAWLELGEIDQAREDCEQALTLDPRDHDALRTRGSVLLLQGEFSAALNDLNRVLDHDNRDVKAYYFRGRARAALGEPAKAIADFNEALAVHPHWPQALLQRGLAHHALGHEKRARTDLAKAHHLNPEIDAETL